MRYIKRLIAAIISLAMMLFWGTKPSTGYGTSGSKEPPFSITKDGDLIWTNVGRMK